MNMITVDKDRCVKDGLCVAVCGSLTLRTNEEGYPEGTPGRMCILCGHCVAACACDALTHSGLPQEEMLPAAKTLPDPALLDSFLNSRRSVREFKEQPVPRETMEALLDVGRRAPTAGNTQQVRWIVVSGKAKVHALAEEAVNWVRVSEDPLGIVALWDKGYDFVLRSAPTVVVACTPPDWIWAKEDAAIALTFLELAAEARGIGVCWAGFLGVVAGKHAPIRRMLKVPDGYAVQGALMLGEPKYKYQYVPPRRPLVAQWL